ncbi:ribosomal L1 domain-containing protein 1 [Microcaecilia unicolor]|uniref:Ribosomal L1 domain-containing protein 1 n=1 Tax=Microcaecilia unicolor TaxID=1415580 RepID=A0A6P7YYG0_9AMPH|nr:ribosomal L1 domain-containing protein 1 [Microcaecilia unicolor]
MATSVAEPLLDRGQIKKAVQALLAYNKTKANANALLLNESEKISLLVTVWKIPGQDKVIKIYLPHGIRPETTEVCIFTKDEPNMSPEQTEKFYKALLGKHGIKNIGQIIPYKTLKKEYKPYEAKRRLLASYDLFLADDRIRRLLPSHIGKHFYKAKRAPLSVNLKAKDLAAELNRFIQGTILPVHNKGCCYAARVGHTGMKAEDLVENVISSVEVIAEKLPDKWKNVKILHLKTQTSVALPIFTSCIYNAEEEELLATDEKEKQQKPKANKDKKKLKNLQETSTTKTTKNLNSTSVPVEHVKIKKGRAVVSAAHEVVPTEQDEDMPQLVPIQNESLLQNNTDLSETLEKKVTLKSDTKSPGKKTNVLVQETPKQKRKVSEEELAQHQTPSKQKKVGSHKKLKPEGKASGPSPAKNTPEKTSETQATKIAGVVKGKKLVKSAKKAPKTPKPNQPKRKGVPQSA